MRTSTRSTTALLSSSLSIHTPCVQTYLCFNYSLETPVGYKLKVLLHSQIISYYMLCIDIYNKYREP